MAETGEVTREVETSPGDLVEELPGCLWPVLGREVPRVPVTGPWRWWRGPLDVEGLALGSVRAAAAAVTAFAGTDVGLGVEAGHVCGAFGSLGQLRVDGRRAEGFAPLSGFFPTRDGWLRTHANYPHHERALARALGAVDRAEVPAILQESKSQDAERWIRAAGGVAAAVRTPPAWRASDQGRAVDGTPWIDFDAPQDTSDRAVPGLEGLRVLDLTRVIAGPTCTQLLALLGADVLRIDPPHLPELLDQHLDRDAGKRTALADLRDSATLATVRGLLADADVLVTGYRSESLARFGLDWRSVHSDFPHVVMVELDAWGRTGPWARQRGFDSIVQAAVGIAHLYARTTPDGPRPGVLPVQALDHATGYGMAAATLALLHRRRITAAAGHAHLSLARTAHLLLDHPAGTQGTFEAPPIPLQATPSPHGALEHTAPALLRNGQTMTFPHAPGQYGADDLAWRPS